jgi:hypothetical protein
MTGNYLTNQPDDAGMTRPQFGRPGRYKLQRRFGRGSVVKRRNTTQGWIAKTSGIALITLGIGAFGIGLLTDITVAGGKPIALVLAGGQAMIMGAILCCYQALLFRSSQNEEALRFQYDIGYEAGWREGDQQTRPVVVAFDRKVRA